MLRLRWQVRRTPIALLAAVLAGCGEAPAPRPASTPAASQSAPVKLVVTVVGDPELAEGIELQRGAWQAASGGDFEVRHQSLAAVDGEAAVSGDVLVFPSRLLGALVERGDVQPMRESVLAKPELALGDIYPAVRAEMNYGEKTFALPLGSPPLLPCYGATVIERRGGQPPATLAEFRRLTSAARGDAAEGGNDAATSAPVFAGAGDAAAHLLVLRALAYVDASRRPEAMFAPEDMAPRITEEPFARALAEIVEEQARSTDWQEVDLAGAVVMVQRGAAGAAFGWPGIVGAASGSGDVGLVFAAPPVADQEYSPSQSKWQKQTLPEPASYVGAAGRLMAVGSRSRNAVTAFQLCAWLSASERVSQISARSRATLWYRRSQSGARSAWTGGQESRGDGDDSAAAVAAALGSEAPFIVPRIPGIDDYLSALGAAVRSAMSKESDARGALEQAAEDFEHLTDERGRGEQARAYRRHLGLERVDVRTH